MMLDGTRTPRRIQHLYIHLSSASDTPAAASIVVVEYKINTDKCTVTEFLQAWSFRAEHAKNFEPGTICLAAMAVIDDPTRIMVYLRCANSAARQEHADNSQRDASGATHIFEERGMVTSRVVLATFQEAAGCSSGHSTDTPALTMVTAARPDDGRAAAALIAGWQRAEGEGSDKGGLIVERQPGRVSYAGGVVEAVGEGSPFKPGDVILVESFAGGQGGPGHPPSPLLQAAGAGGGYTPLLEHARKVGGVLAGFVTKDAPAAQQPVRRYQPSPPEMGEKAHSPAVRPLWAEQDVAGDRNSPAAGSNSKYPDAVAAGLQSWNSTPDTSG